MPLDVLGLGDLPQLGASSPRRSAVEPLAVRACSARRSAATGCSILRHERPRCSGGVWPVDDQRRQVARARTGSSPSGRLVRTAVWARRSSRQRARTGALGDDGVELVGLGGGLEHHLAADGQAEAADPVDPALLEARDRGLDVACRRPSRSMFGWPSLRPSPRRSNSSTPYPWRASIRAWSCGPLRPGKAMIAAAVARRDVPAVRGVRPSAGLEASRPRAGRRGGSPARRARGVGLHVADAERATRRTRARTGRRRRARASSEVAARAPARPPQRDGAEPDQPEAGGRSRPTR